MRPSGRWLPLMVTALLATACGGSDETAEESDASSSSSTTVTETTAPSTSSNESLVASTASTTSTTEAPASTTTSTTEATTTTTEKTTSTTEILVIDGGTTYEFSSPSGNIACVMNGGTPQWVSCWIGEKAWTIDQPDGPDCAVSDWGNAVDLSADGPSFPCYTDMLWNIFAPALPYGHVVEVGQFRCESARSGVTCTNDAGRGFTLARAGVQLF